MTKMWQYLWRVSQTLDLETAVSSSRQLALDPPFVIININADNADISGDVRDNTRVQTNVGRTSTTTRRPSRRPRPTLPDDFLADNPFINLNQDTMNLTPGDMKTILDIINMNDNRVVNNNISPSSGVSSSDPLFTTCPAATLCVDRSRCDTWWYLGCSSYDYCFRCDFNGVITSSSVSLNPRIASLQVALNVRILSSFFVRFLIKIFYRDVQQQIQD